jgi:hypothetical protein
MRHWYSLWFANVGQYLWLYANSHSQSAALHGDLIFTSCWSEGIYLSANPSGSVISIIQLGTFHLVTQYLQAVAKISQRVKLLKTWCLIDAVAPLISILILKKQISSTIRRLRFAGRELHLPPHPTKANQTIFPFLLSIVSSRQWRASEFSCCQDACPQNCFKRGTLRLCPAFPL